MKSTTPSQEVTHFEIGWLAGLVDGEGSIAFYFSRRKDGNGGFTRRSSPSYRVYIINSDMAILNKAKDILIRLGITFLSIREKAATKKQREGSFKFTKPCYALDVSRRKDVELYLNTIIDHLQGYKKVQATKLLEFFRVNPFNSRKQLRV